VNRLFYGDNLQILRRDIKDESIDLIYLDPPFNSNRSYNILFKHKTGDEAQAQIEAFGDTWTWSQQSEDQYDELVQGGAPLKVADALIAMRQLLGDNDVLAYLVMMTARLVELHRVLKETGSLYLHCDPTASHYLKLILDAIFGPVNFKNEIIWRRTGAHGKVKRFGPIHDVILFYTKSDTYTWNYPKKRYMRGHVEEYFEEDDKGWKTAYYGNVLTGAGTRNGESGTPWLGIDPTEKGRHWAVPGSLVEDVDEDMTQMSQREKLERLYELGYIKLRDGDAWPIYERYVKPTDGTPAPDLWTYQPYTQGSVFGTEEGIDEDVRWLATRDAERLGYPTQKPLGLLARIIKASSNEGDVVLDPFCGCGTTVDAAQALKRTWVGIDITYLAVDLIQKRLRRTYGDDVRNEYELRGVPKEVEAAQELFNQNAFDFERWAVSLVSGEPNAKQVGDKGIDGVVRFNLNEKKAQGRALVSVKGGRQLNPAMVRDLRGTVERQGAEMGILICMGKPTRGMIEEADHSGSFTYEFSGAKFPKIQIITVPELLAGTRPSMPTPIMPYKIAKRRSGQLSLLDD
jgi:DNA modification methylase